MYGFERSSTIQLIPKVVLFFLSWGVCVSMGIGTYTEFRCLSYLSVVLFRYNLNPRLTKLLFVTRLTKGGGLLQPTPWIFANKPPMNLVLVSIDRY